MTVIGITGGSGSGKSTLSELLREQFCAEVLDADAIYHEMLDADADMQRALTDAFGAHILQQGRISRPKLAAIVFASPEALARLNAITHPRVCLRVRQRLARSTAPVAAVDAFGLLESGLDALCDHTVAVLAPRQDRIARICLRDGLSPEAAAARIDAQKPDAFYRERCKYILENRADSLADFRAQCRALCLQILGKDVPDHV